MTGRLYVVGTPIGNLQDLSPRALSVLGEVDLIAAEDTRHSGRLLQHFGIRRPLRSLHAHNESGRSAELLARLREGARIALISDAGMPLISDPGFELVNAARGAGIPIEVVPGPTALTAALAIAGLPADRFLFEGFLPAKSAARRRALAALRDQPRTVVLYESPHRIAACLADIAAELGADRGLCLARELTKRHETVLQGTAAELAAWAAEPGADRKGEYVVLIRGAETVPGPANAIDHDLLLDTLAAELPARTAAKVAAKLTGEKTNVLYQRLQLRNGGKGG